MNALSPIVDAEPMLPLSLPPTRTFDEWSSLGHKLLDGRRKIDWLIGDWLIQGSERYGEKARTLAVSIFRSDVERFAPIVDVCRRFPDDQRHDLLSFGHHLAVMVIEDDEQAQTMLAKAEVDRMTVAALKAEVKVSTNRQTTILEDDDPDDTAYRLGVQFLNKLPKHVRMMIVEAYQETDGGVVNL